MINLIGFENQINTLVENYKSKTLHSSTIIHGPKGIGKKIFIEDFINKVFKINFDNKNYEHHYNLLKNNSHPNIKILEKTIDLKTKKIKSKITIDQVRNLKNFLNESSAIKNLSKFIVIDCADDLNLSSANSILKTLEEPKKNTFIFLISHQLSSLLPTIRSRCLKIKLNNHNYNNFKNILCNQIEKISDDEIKFYFELTFGSPGNAILLHEENFINIFDNTLNSINSDKIDKNCLDLVNFISKLENDKFKSYLSLLKYILIFLWKLKIDDYYNKNNYLLNKFIVLNSLSKKITKQNIIDSFDYISNNESDLFTYNLDKKLFMLKFFTN